MIPITHKLSPIISNLSRILSIRQQDRAADRLPVAGRGRSAGVGSAGRREPLRHTRPARRHAHAQPGRSLADDPQARGPRRAAPARLPALLRLEGAGPRRIPADDRQATGAQPRGDHGALRPPGEGFGAGSGEPDRRQHCGRCPQGISGERLTAAPGLRVTRAAGVIRGEFSPIDLRHHLAFRRPGARCARPAISRSSSATRFPANG